MAASTLKAKFRDGLKNFLETHYNEKQDHLNDIQRSNGFALFYLSQVFGKLNPGVISDDLGEIEQSIVDGKDDQGIDVVFSQDTHHYFIQFKYRGRKTTESDKEVLSFKSVFERIHPDLGFSYNKNQRLRDAIADIDWKQDTFELLFISLSRENDNIRNYENEGVSPIHHPDLRDLDDRASFSFLSEKDLNIEFRDSLSTQELRDVTIQASKDADGKFWYEYKNENGLRSFITNIDAGQIHKLYEYRSNRNSLFNLNIRNFVGDTSTNKGIKESATNDPQNFFFYNNGISAVAKEIFSDANTGKLDCRQFSIINGAQTFRSISRAYTKIDSQSKDAMKKHLRVMVRLTETPDLYKNTEFVERITRYNNTQNAVKISDFRSNDGVQTSLAQYFGKISYGGKTYHYKNKRGKETPRNTIPINLDDFCKIIHSFDKGPIDCFGGIKYLYETRVGGGYYALFGDADNNSILEALSEEQFQNFAAKYFICEVARKEFDAVKKLRMQQEENDREEGEDDNTPLISKGAFHSRYLMLFVLGIIFGRLADLENLTIEEFLKNGKFSDPKWRDNEKKEGLIKDSVELSCDALSDNYMNSMKDPSFVHRNWLRSRETLRDLKSTINISRASSVKHIHEKYRG